jgi:two-component system, LytTR family, response regulator LytT
MHILLIEDEQPAARRLEKLLHEVRENLTLIGPLDSIETSVDYLQNNDQPDLILMDIELADGQSFEIFKQVDVQSPVIFTTAYDEYALQAFKVNSVDYLLKPIDREQLNAAIAKFERTKPDASSALNIDELLAQLSPNSSAYRSRFLVKMGQRMIPVDVKDAAYFHSEDKLTFLHTYEGRRLPLDLTLDDLERSLEPGRYFRANRQFIIAVDTVQNVHMHFNGKLKLDLKPKPEGEVFVSREKSSTFKQWLGA